jgi:hypothetical protein
MQIVGAYLKGAAATWLSNKRLLGNWPTQWNPTNAAQAADQNASFTYQFKLQFRTQDRVYEWQRQLKERKQLSDESVEQYAAAIRELLRRVDPDNNYPVHLQVSQFIDGLKPEIRFFVNPTRPATLEDAINTAQLHNANFQQYTQMNTIPQFSIPTAPSLMTIPFLPQTQTESEVTKLTKQLEKLKVQLKQKNNSNNSNNNTNNNSNNNRFNNRRNNNNNGNNSRYIPECYKCRKLGHLMRDCPLNKNDNFGRNNYNNRSNSNWNNNNNQNNNNNNWKNNNNNNNNNNQNNKNNRQNTYLNTNEHLNS